MIWAEFAQMFERFTEKSIKAILHAEEEARRLGHNYVGPEHILLGLIRENTGNAAKALKLMDITTKDVRAEVQKLNGQKAGEASEKLSYTPTTKRLLGASLREAQSIGADYISTDYLLLGLISDDNHENQGINILMHLGADLFKLKEQLTRTAVTESIYYRRPATERPRKRSTISDEMVYEALTDTLNNFRQVSDKEVADGRINQGLVDVVKSLRKAQKIAMDEQQVELAVWISMQDRNLIEKFQELGGSILDLGQMLKDTYSEADQRLFQRLKGLNMQALNALRLAKEESHRLGRNYVGAEQILLGLIAEDNGNCARVIVRIDGKEQIGTPPINTDFGIAAKVFKSLGVALEDARAEVEKIVGTGDDVVVVDPPFTDVAERILELSRVEALRLNPEAESRGLYVGTEHLLLALIREIEEQSADVAQKVLSDLGVDLIKIKEKVLYLEPDARLIAGFVAPAVIELAKEEACRQGHNSIGTEHLLLGLIREGFGIASRSLKLVDVNIDDARVQVEKIVERGSGLTVEELLFSPGVKRLFEHSREEAKQLGHGYLGTEHILLAMINQKDCAETNTALRVLQSMEIDIEKLRHEITSRLMNLRTGITGENFLK